MATQDPTRTTSFVVDPFQTILTSEEPATDPPTREHVLDVSPDGRVIRGIWEIGPGVTEDVEEDELFVVLSGRATVELESGETLELKPGSVGVLRRGQHARWTVHETLRKVFQITTD